MKVKTALALLILFFVYASATATAAHICGRLHHFGEEEGATELTAFWATLTAVKLERQTVEVAPDGSFCFKAGISRRQEVALSYQGTWIPLLLAPGDSIFLDIDARHFREGGNPWTGVKISGSPSVPTRQALAFKAAYDLHFSERPEPEVEPFEVDKYKSGRLGQLREDMEFLQAWQEQNELGETARDWLWQDLNYNTARDLFLFILRRSRDWGDENLIYRVVDTDYFDYWDRFWAYEPTVVVSIAFQQYLTTHSNYKRFQLSKKHIPNHEELEGREARHAAWLEKIDSIELGQLLYLLSFEPGFVRDAAAAVFSGILLDYDVTAGLLRPGHIQEIADKALREEIQAKYDIVHAPAEEAGIVPGELALPDTVENILPWLARAFPGKAIVVDVWATWCGSCLYAIEQLYPDFIKEYEGKEVVFVFTGCCSQENLWRKKARAFPFSAPHIFISEEQYFFLQRTYGVYHLPHHFVIGRDGAVVDGDAPGPGEGLRKMLKEALEK